MLSYTRGATPRLADHARDFRLLNASRNPEGLCLLPPGKSVEAVDLAALRAGMPADRRPALIHDPHPTDPFRDLTLYLTKAWVGVLSPAALYVVLLLLGWRRRWGSRFAAISGLLLAIPVTADLYVYGRVSTPCTLAAKTAVILMSLVAAYCTYRAFKARRWVFAGIVTVGLVVLAYYAAPAVRYA
jgi:hypothetical protein